MKRRTPLVCTAALLLAGCGAADSAASFGAAPRDANEAPEPAPGGAGTNAPGEAPPEKEVESDYEAPVATGRFVWIANPKSGRVAYVDATTLQVRTVEAGNGPTFLAAVPGQTDDATVVLNVLSQDATLLRASASAITTKTLKVAPKANALAFSEDGRFAIAWADARKEPKAPKQEGFQDLTVLDLTAGTSTVLAVGYRPVSVGFGSGGRAYAVTQDGVALVDLAGVPKVTKNVAISATPSEDPGTRDVFVTKDGAYAFVRRDGAPSITAVALDTGVRTEIVLGGPVTDLDLSSTGDRAVAVVRETAQAVVLPIPAIVGNPAAATTFTITGETIGSVSLAPGGNKAMLYTNAAAVERFTILDVPGAKFRTVRLYSPVLGIFPAPDARHAIVLHDKTADGAPGAFSVVPVADELPARIVATQAPPSAVAVSPERAMIAERDDRSGTFGAYLVRMPQLMVERFPLASPPSAVGIVPSANRAFVSQLHPEGRITFFDLDTGMARTLTGFELSSRVVDGSKP